MSVSFAPWGVLPETPDIQKRLKSASGVKLTPLELDRENMSGVFSGSGGIYHTRLNYCQCTDYGIQQKKGKNIPCKHILRLAMELGLIDVPFESDATKINAPKPKEKKARSHGVASLPLIVSIIENEFDEKTTCYRLLADLLSAHSHKQYLYREDISRFQVLIDNSIISVVNPPDTEEYPSVSMPAAWLDSGEHMNECFFPLKTFVAYYNMDVDSPNFEGIPDYIHELLMKYSATYRINYEDYMKDPKQYMKLYNGDLDDCSEDDLIF